MSVLYCTIYCMYIHVHIGNHIILYTIIVLSYYVLYITNVQNLKLPLYTTIRGQTFFVLYITSVIMYTMRVLQITIKYSKVLKTTINYHYDTAHNHQGPDVLYPPCNQAETRLTASHKGPVCIRSEYKQKYLSIDV